MGRNKLCHHHLVLLLITREGWKSPVGAVWPWRSVYSRTINLMRVFTQNLCGALIDAREFFFDWHDLEDNLSIALTFVAG